MIDFDVLIPVGKDDVNFVHRVIMHVSEKLNGVNKIYILASLLDAKKLRRTIKNDKCIVLDENNLVQNLTYQRIKGILKSYIGSTSITGWYFQQLLKIAFAQSKYCCSYYLTWDADTIPLSSISFFDENHILYNPKNEYNRSYFKTIQKLFGTEKIIKESYISEHMMFKKDIVQEMIFDIEHSELVGDDWIEKILYACDMSDSIQAFSEFETYGTYCALKYPDLYKPRHLNTFRMGGIICGRSISETRIKKLSFDLDTISFEMRDMPMFPYNIPNILWLNKKRFVHIKEMSLKEIILRFNEKIKGIH